MDRNATITAKPATILVFLLLGTLISFLQIY
jgi:hypothetical protein